MLMRGKQKLYFLLNRIADAKEITSSDQPLILDPRITESYYNQKREEHRAKQKDINGKIGKLHYADEEYYITADYLLQLAKRSYELFESSEPMDKRQLLKLSLQNLRLEGGLVHYDLIKPFDKIYLFASRQDWLPLQDSDPGDSQDSA